MPFFPFNVDMAFECPFPLSGSFSLAYGLLVSISLIELLSWKAITVFLMGSKEVLHRKGVGMWDLGWSKGACCIGMFGFEFLVCLGGGISSRVMSSL